MVDKRDDIAPAVSLEATLEWFERAEKNAAKQGRMDSSLLWADGRAWLLRLQRERDEAHVLIGRYRRGIVAMYAAGYDRSAQTEVARVCDEIIDRSGRLLGEIRDEARSLTSGREG